MRNNQSIHIISLSSKKTVVIKIESIYSKLKVQSAKLIRMKVSKLISAERIYQYRQIFNFLVKVNKELMIHKTGRNKILVINEQQLMRIWIIFIVISENS